MYLEGGKRALDVGFVTLSAPIVLPVVAIGWVAARLSSGDSGFFTQVRIGKDLQPFRLVKLRTMRDVPGATLTAANDHRVTTIGRILRQHKIDEMPQLWNVLIGDMSLVGSRPELPNWVEGLETAFASQLEVRPGLTDLASLIYHDESQRLAERGFGAYLDEILPEKLRLASLYRRHVSLWLDFQLIALTVVSTIAPAWAARLATGLADRLSSLDRHEGRK